MRCVSPSGSTRSRCPRSGRRTSWRPRRTRRGSLFIPLRPFSQTLANLPDLLLMLFDGLPQSQNLLSLILLRLSIFISLIHTDHGRGSADQTKDEARASAQEQRGDEHSHEFRVHPSMPAHRKHISRSEVLTISEHVRICWTRWIFWTSPCNACKTRRRLRSVCVRVSMTRVTRSSCCFNVS